MARSVSTVYSTTSGDEESYSDTTIVTPSSATTVFSNIIEPIGLL